MNLGTSVLEAGKKGTSDFWRIEFTPRLTPEQWKLYSVLVEEHQCYVNGVYIQSKCIDVLRRIAPDLRIL